jgi:mono/diheme cytochrome c family protein
MGRINVRLPLALSLILMAGSQASSQERVELEGRGRALLAEYCSRCHAIERTDNSPHREAPPFRTLGQRYPIEGLAESLAEGLFTGHPDMPEFVFESHEVGAILTYMRSIQVPKSGDRTNR